MMQLKSVMRAGSYTVVIFLILAFDKSAAAQSNKLNDNLPSQAKINIGANTPFAALIASSELHQPEEFARARNLLTSLESSPSCTRLATATLLTSCQTLEGSSKDVEHGSENPEAFLDNVKSIYAARLAVCELVGAGASVPVECSPMILSGSAKKQQGLRGYLSRNGGQKSSKDEPRGFGNVGHSQLGDCLRSLESKPQWWTSYSNGRQNAVVMCKAVRTDIEKDEILALHKSVTEVTADLSLTLSKTLQESGSHLENHRTFLQAVRQFQTQLQKDLDSTSSKTRGFFAGIAQDMESVMQAVINKIHVAGKAAEVNFSLLNQNIHASNGEIKNLRDNVSKVFQKVVSGSSELAANQAREWEVSRDLVRDVQNSLEQVKGSEMQELLGLLRSIHSGLHTSNEMIMSLHLKQTVLDERLATLDAAFEVLEMRTRTVSIAQKDQADNQWRLQESLREEIDTARGLLMQVAKSASILQSTVDETSVKVKEMGAFGGIGSAAGRWAWLAIILVGIGIVSRKAAGFIAIGIGFTCALIASGLPEQLVVALSQLSGANLAPQIRQAHFWVNLRLAMLGVCLAVGTIFAVLRCCKGLHQQKDVGVLPTVETHDEKSLLQ